MLDPPHPSPLRGRLPPDAAPRSSVICRIVNALITPDFSLPTANAALASSCVPSALSHFPPPLRLFRRFRLFSLSTLCVALRVASRFVRAPDFSPSQCSACRCSSLSVYFDPRPNPCRCYVSSGSPYTYNPSNFSDSYPRDSHSLPRVCDQLFPPVKLSFVLLVFTLIHF